MLGGKSRFSDDGPKLRRYTQLMESCNYTPYGSTIVESFPSAQFVKLYGKGEESL